MTRWLQIVLGVRSPADGALPIARDLIAARPDRDIDPNDGGARCDEMNSAEADPGQHRERRQDRPGGQTVQAVGQIHRMRGR